MKSDFEKRKQARIDRYEELAEKAEQHSIEQLKEMGYNVDQADAFMHPQYSYEKPGFQT